MVLHRHRHRSVGAKILNEEHEQFVALARQEGLKPAQLLARLVRAELARAAAPSMVPEIEERRVYA